jgi:hypothetical protein
MNSWFNRINIANENGNLVVMNTLWDRLLATNGILSAKQRLGTVVSLVVGTGLTVGDRWSDWPSVIGIGILALSGIVLLVDSAFTLFCPAEWIFAKDKGVLVYRPFFSLALLDLKRITHVLIRTQAPYYHYPDLPGGLKVPCWEYDLLLVCTNAGPLTMLEAESASTVRPIALAVSEYLCIPIIQTDTNPSLLSRAPQLFGADDPAATGLPDYIRELADGGHRILAIQAYRQFTGRSRDESVHAVDAYLKGKEQ